MEISTAKLTVKKDNNQLIANCKCGSWINHWNNFNKKKKPAVFCSEINCTEMSELAGRCVQKIAGDTDWYVIPLCKKHHASSSEIDINDFTELVPANKGVTCD